ncbi:MAG: penicillin-binding protein activator LpoB [Polyangiaceae bacterium]|nr:penicillin-binding protein activator LpoB [Polyangiaceae bacterium]
MTLRFVSPMFILASALVLSVGAAGCGGKRVVRGANDPSVDAPALSTSLDRDDVQRALSETLNKLRESPVMYEWRTSRPPATVAVFPFQNETSEHIDSMLSAMLSETETWLVESNTVQMIARDRQDQIIREVEGQQHPIFNPANAARYGRQLGAKYFITGKVSASDERARDMRRVQYFIFLQVIEIETSAIKFQARTYITKAIK